MFKEITMKDRLGYSLKIIEKKCPCCGFEGAITLDSGSFDTIKNYLDCFVSWCPCGTIFNEEKVLQVAKNQPRDLWWEQFKEEL